jgi:hypothetical protein
LFVREGDWFLVHPDDVDTVRQKYSLGWQLCCFRYCGREGDYDVLDDGEQLIRVCDALIEPIPAPRYKHGQRVYASRKQAHGVVRVINWHFNRKEPYYGLEVNGRRSGFWYFDGDLEPEKE